MAHPCRDWTLYTGSSHGNSEYIDPPGGPMDIITRWLPEIFKLYDSAVAAAKRDAAIKYAEDCENWPQECNYKFGDFAIQWSVPVSRRVGTTVGGHAVVRTELEAVVNWRLLVWCGPHGEVRDPKVDKLAQVSWERMTEEIAIYKPNNG